MDVLTDLTGISLKEDYIMNFKTIAIAVSATATIAAGVMTFRAHKLSKQEAVEYDMTDEEISELSTEELQSMIAAARVEEEAIAAAPKATKVFGMLTLISTVTLTAFIISNQKDKVEAIADTVEYMTSDDILSEQPEHVQAYANTVKTIAERNGTTAEFIGVDSKGNIDMHIEDKDKVDDIIEQLELTDVEKK